MLAQSEENWKQNYSLVYYLRRMVAKALYV